MAILAALPNVGEYGPDVTLGAGDGLMHAAQWIFCLVVVEFRNGADRPPRIGRVAVLAGYVQVSVWAVRSSRGLCPGKTRSSGECQKKE